MRQNRLNSVADFHLRDFIITVKVKGQKYVNPYYFMSLKVFL